MAILFAVPLNIVQPNRAHATAKLSKLDYDRKATKITSAA